MSGAVTVWSFNAQSATSEFAPAFVCGTPFNPFCIFFDMFNCFV
jgi:hypothetical protein